VPWSYALVGHVSRPYKQSRGIKLSRFTYGDG